MRRRTLLGAVGTALVPLAGCRSVIESTRTPPPEAALPTVSVTYSSGAGWSPVHSTALRLERSEVTYDVRCQDEGVEGLHVERSFDEAEYVELQRLVWRSRPDRWREEYPCRGDCPVDAATLYIDATVDGGRLSTSFSILADLPEEIDALRDFLEGIEDRVDDPNQCSESGPGP